MLFRHVLYQLSYRRIFYFWENDGIRTHDQRSHNPLLYQLSYNLHISAFEGIEPPYLMYTIVPFISSLL